VTNIRLKHL